ncbi:MAG: transporter [Planctomycetes bacterium]|nr:transporter [Planctomycetota bacterium]
MPRSALVLFAAAAVLPAQNVLDDLDGETLYDGGNLISVSHELDREEVLRRGSRREVDPAASHRFRSTTTLAWLHGLRNDLQLGIALPYADVETESATGQQVTAGVGDLELLAKWRFHRWDTRGASINSALLLHVSLPTGEDDAGASGLDFEPEQQVGSGGVDPSIGVAITPEPGRWRFNAAVLYTLHTDSDGDGDQRGDALFAELAVGNRFWLEPYPGPFMRLDLLLRWRDEQRDTLDHARLADTGGQQLTAGVTWAFRPRPAIDLQLGVEVPLWRDANGAQLDRDWTALTSMGYRF